MLSSTEFIRQSLELHLFFARIMKEHSFFLEAGFTPKDSSWMQHADNIRKNAKRDFWRVFNTPKVFYFV